MIKHKKSHLDHGLSEQQIAYILERFADKRAFFIETFLLPDELGTVPCGLWGPAMNDAPIGDGPLGERGTWSLPPGDYILPAVQAHYVGRHAGWSLPTFDGEITRAKRGTRSHESRLINAPLRPTSQLSVIAGPYTNVETGELLDCILYTAFGGPIAPYEPGDPALPPDTAEASRSFWSMHALSRYA